MDVQNNWYSRARAEANKGIPSNERFTGVLIVIVSILMICYFAAHQTQSTGFFTAQFSTLEHLMLYGYWTFWIITASLEGIFGQRLLSRLFDVFGGGAFAVICAVGLILTFPFDFVHFADVLPESLRFSVQWISNDIARGVMVLATIALAGGLAYCPIAYKFIVIGSSGSKSKDKSSGWVLKSSYRRSLHKTSQD